MPTQPPHSLLHLDQQLCFPLYAASNAITRAYRPLLEPLGLTYPQYLVMMVLWEQAPQMVSEIGHKLHLDSGTLTPLLKRLQTQGLVVRQRDAADERRVLVTLTEAGQALKAQAESVPRSMACHLLNSAIDLPQLRQELRQLLQALTAGTTISPETDTNPTQDQAA